MSTILVPSSQPIYEGETQPSTVDPSLPVSPRMPHPRREEEIEDADLSPLPSSVPSPRRQEAEDIPSGPSGVSRKLALGHSGDSGDSDDDDAPPELEAVQDSDDDDYDRFALPTARRALPAQAEDIPSGPPGVSRQVGFVEEKEDDRLPAALMDEDDDDVDDRFVFRPGDGNQEAYYQRLNLYQPYNEASGPNETQDVNLARVAAHFSPSRPSGNLSGSPSTSDMDGFDLMPVFNALVVDTLNDECPQADIGGGMHSVFGFTTRIKASAVLVQGKYHGLREMYRFAGSTRNYGRLYSLNGSQSVMGKVRRHLFDDSYEDVDIVNALPSMIPKLMREMGYTGDHDVIDLYCNERDDCLDRVCAAMLGVSRDDAKTLFISILFGSSLRAWEETHGTIPPDLRADLLEPWERQVSAFVRFFIEERGDEIAAFDKKTDAQIEAEGKSPAHRRFSLFMQNEERIVMQHAIDFVRTIDQASVGVLVHDGILVHVPGGAERILAPLQSYILRRTGYDLVFAVKSLTPTETLVDLVLQLKGVSTNIDIPVYDSKENKDTAFLNAFIAINEDKLLFDERAQIYHYGDGSYGIYGRGLWHLGTPPGVWWAHIFPDTPYALDANKILVMNRLIKNFYPQHYAQIKWELYDDHWIPLRDCLVSLISEETRAFSPELHLNRKIDLVYTPDALTDPWFAQQVDEMFADMRRLYNNDPQLEAACEELLAYALFTRGNPLKKIINLVGSGNNGKSTFLQRVIHLGGAAFATTLDAKHLCGRSDPTKPNPGLRAAMQANFVSVEEPDKDEPMSAAKLKEMSGNTESKQRDLFANHALSQKNNCVLFICSNHPVQCKNMDAATVARMERINMPCKFFRNEGERSSALASIESGIERMAIAPTYHVGDTSFAQRYEKPEMRQVYFAYLKKRYADFVSRGSLTEVPDEYSYRGCEDGEIEPAPEDLYDELVEETGADTDFMTCKQLCALLGAKNTISLGLAMKSRITKSTKVKDARKKKQRGFTGIRPRDNGGPSFVSGGVTAYDNGFTGGFF